LSVSFHSLIRVGEGRTKSSLSKVVRFRSSSLIGHFAMTEEQVAEVEHRAKREVKREVKREEQSAEQREEQSAEQREEQSAEQREEQSAEPRAKRGVKDLFYLRQ
jgi:uncharacterized membrane protein